MALVNRHLSLLSVDNMVSSNGWRALALSLALVPQAMADICATLEAGGIDIENRISLVYNYDLTEYSSTACGDLKPTCIAAPSSAAEMAQVVKNLHNVDTLLFVLSFPSAMISTNPKQCHQEWRT